MSPIHANTLNTSKTEQSRLTNEEEDGKDGETNGNDKISLAPHFEENKELNKAEPSTTIVISSINAQERSSGDTPLSTPKVVPTYITPSLNRKRKEIKYVSPDIEVSLDEIIEMPQFDLANITLQQNIFLQEILKKKKRQEQLR